MTKHEIESPTEHRSTAGLRASQARVLQMFRLYGETTDKQLIEYLNEMEKAAGLKPMSASGARTRRAELVRFGKLRQLRKEVVDGRRVSVWGLV